MPAALTLFRLIGVVNVPDPEAFETWLVLQLEHPHRTDCPILVYYYSVVTCLWLFYCFVLSGWVVLCN